MLDLKQHFDWFLKPITNNEEGEVMYNVQCLVGHVFKTESGSDLERRCAEREKQGYFDALCLSVEECPDCEEERLQVSIY